MSPPSASDAAKSPGVEGYRFVTAGWVTARASRYRDTSGAREKTAQDLNARFAGWFYAIANADFQKLRLAKKDLLR
jgi:hypothetical protein